MVYLFLLVIIIFILVCIWFYFELLDNEKNGYYEYDFIEPYTVNYDSKGEE